MEASDIPAGYYDGSVAVSGLTLKTPITVSAGTISVSPDPGYDYLVLLPEGTHSVTITPEFLDKYNGTSYFKDGDDVVTSITVDSVDLESNGEKTIMAYTYGGLLDETLKFKVETINPYLASLGTLPTGFYVDKAFDKDTLNYLVDLPETAVSFLFAPQLDNPDSTLAVYEHGGTAGTATSATVALAPGDANKKTYDVVVTAQDLSTKTYTVTFTRREPVSSISVSAGTLTPAFNEGTADYVVNLPITATSIVITSDMNAPDCNYLDINGSPSPYELSLSPGENTATITATDKDDRSTTTYTVKVNRVAALTNIVLNTGTLAPAFDPTVSAYSVYVPYSTASVTITPILAAGQTVKINNKSVSSLALPVPAGGSATATIECTGLGQVQTYYVTVYRIMPISKISVSTGALVPAFSAGVYSYTDSVPATTTSVTVSVTKTASLVSMTINGTAAVFGSTGIATVKLSPASGGSSSAVIVARAVNGLDYTYTVTAKRAALLTNITTSAGKLTPKFSATTTSYQVLSVPATTSSVKITPVKASKGVKYIKINNKTARSITLKPALGGTATATITVYASDGKTKVTYKVVVYRNGLLSGIGTSTGVLSPAFSMFTGSYTVNIPADYTDPVVITPVKATYAKTVTINGKVQASMPLTPVVGGSAKAIIVVTMTDGRTKQTYTVTVIRHAPLTGITLSAGVSLSPGFTTLTHEYTVSLPAAMDSVTITPQRAAGCNYVINSGTANTPYTSTLALGGHEDVTIVATAPDGHTSLTYTLHVRRANLLSGIAVTHGTLNFDAATASYTVEVGSGVSEVRVTPATTAGCTATFDTDPAVAAYKDISIDAGGTASMVVHVTDGTDTADYTITFKRAPALASMAITDSGDNDLTLNTAFAAGTLAYTVHAPVPAEGSDAVTVTVDAAAATGSTITSTVPATATKPADGDTATVTITVEGTNGMPAVTYTVTVVWDLV
jgi:hypothetical protein